MDTKLILLRLRRIERREQVRSSRSLSHLSSALSGLDYVTLYLSDDLYDDFPRSIDQDTTSLQNDWKNIGRDIRKAMKLFEGQNHEYR